MLCFRSHSSKSILFHCILPLHCFYFWKLSPFTPSTSSGYWVFGEKEHSGVLTWSTRRSLADDTVQNSSLILAEERTHRKDPFDKFERYTGGWNISNKHYWASVGFTAAPFFIVAGVWFLVFGLTLSIICLCYCCCRRDPYGYSRIAYALSLIFLILFTIAAIIGCIVLYTGQGKFHSSTTNTLDYVVNQADVTVENLRNVSDYLAAAKRIRIESVTLPAEIQHNIDQIQTKINSSATTLADKTQDNSKDIQHGLDSMRLALIVIAAFMLFLAFIGFFLSIFGLQGLVYTLVIVGWVLVAGTFILSGVFLLLHNVVADTCVAMGEWVLNPTAHTALDDILPCVDNATAQETLLQSKDVTYQLVNVVNTVINNVTNINFPPNVKPLYYNQSGPRMPNLCSPFHANRTAHQCPAGEVELKDAREVWKNYTCEVSASGDTCVTLGRMTPAIYEQMTAAVNVSYGLYHYGPFLKDLQDCTFVRLTFTDISKTYCPGPQKHSKGIYTGLALVSAAVMLSLIFWVIYAREQRHRVYTKLFMTSSIVEHQGKP